MKPAERRRGESVLSLVCGVPSLAIAAGAVTMLASYVVGHPIGPAEFREVVLVRVRETTAVGQAPSQRANEYTLPSMRLLGMLCVGMGFGCVGMVLGRRRRRHGRMTTCAVGAVACLVALGLAWILYATAAWG